MNTFWLVILLNLGVITSVWFLFLKFYGPLKKVYWFGFISVLVIPLFWWHPPTILMSILILVSTLLIFLYKPRFLVGGIVLSIVFILVFINGLLAGNILKISPQTNSVMLDLDWTIFYNSFIKDTIKATIDQYRGEVGLQFSPISFLYNKAIGYTIYATKNIFYFITLANLYKVILLANLYPFLLGLYTFDKKYRVGYFIFLTWLVVILITVGINRSPNNFGLLYAASPALLFFIYLGFQKVNMKLHLLLLLVSMVIFFSPRI